MLNAMREGTKSGFMRFILFGFMVLAVGGLVMMDVGGFFRGGVSRTSIAKIDGQELPITIFDRTLRRVLANQSLDIQTAYRLGFVNQVLSNEISNNLTQRAALDMGLEIGDNIVLKQINKLIEPLVTEELTKKAALTAVLRNQGMTEQSFIRMIKAEMTNMLLRNTIQIGTDFGPEKEALDLYQHKNEERTVKVVFLSHSNIKDVTIPTDEVLLPFYQAGQERYAIPENRSFSIAILSQDKLEKTMGVEEEELRAVYEQDIASFSLPERRVLEQAVFDNQAAATAIISQVNEDKSLKEESGDAYLGEETFEKEGLLKEIGEVAFAASTGETVGPIETALGWHVIKLKNVIAPETEPFDKVKDDLKKDIIQLRLVDEMFVLANNIDDSLAGGLSLEEVAGDMDLTLKQYGPVKSDGSTPDGKDGSKEFEEDRGYILETVFELLEGEISPVIELTGGRYAAIRADVINEKNYKAFDEVKGGLGKLWMQDQREVANKLKAQDALRDLNSGGKNLTDIATANGASIKTYNLVRADSPPEPLNKTVKDLFYLLPEGQYGTGRVKDGLVIGHITNVNLPKTDKVSEETLQPFVDLAKQSVQGEFMQLYFNHLQSAYDVKINQRLLDATYGPGNEQF